MGHDTYTRLAPPDREVHFSRAFAFVSYRLPLLGRFSPKRAAIGASCMVGQRHLQLEVTELKFGIYV